MRELNSDLINDWIATLRSGQYKQVKRALATKDGGFCCLGVLCEVAGCKKVDSGYDRYAYYLGDGTTLTGMLLGGLRDFLENRGIDPDLLVNMNDEDGKTFNEIADYIADVLENGVPEKEKCND